MTQEELWAKIYKYAHQGIPIEDIDETAKDREFKFPPQIGENVFIAFFSTHYTITKKD